MLYLIKKELTANIQYMLYGIVIFLVYSVVFSKNGSGLFMICLVFCYYAIFTTNLIIDERYKMNMLISVLPINRRDIIISKYIFAAIIFVMCILFYTVILVVARAIGYNYPTLTLFSLSLGLFVLCLFHGLMLPLAYRFGAQATRYVSLIIVMGFFFLSAFIDRLLPALSEAALTQMNATTGSLLLIAVSLVMTLISFMITDRVYKNKDL